MAIDEAVGLTFWQLRNTRPRIGSKIVKGTHKGEPLLVQTIGDHFENRAPQPREIPEGSLPVYASEFYDDGGAVHIDDDAIRVYMPNHINEKLKKAPSYVKLFWAYAHFLAERAKHRIDSPEYNATMLGVEDFRTRTNTSELSEFRQALQLGGESLDQMIARDTPTHATLSRIRDNPYSVSYREKPNWKDTWIWKVLSAYLTESDQHWDKLVGVHDLHDRDPYRLNDIKTKRLKKNNREFALELDKMLFLMGNPVSAIEAFMMFKQDYPSSTYSAFGTNDKTEYVKRLIDVLTGHNSIDQLTTIVEYGKILRIPPELLVVAMDSVVNEMDDVLSNLDTILHPQKSQQVVKRMYAKIMTAASANMLGNDHYKFKSSRVSPHGGSWQLRDRHDTFIAHTLFKYGLPDAFNIETHMSTAQKIGSEYTVAKIKIDNATEAVKALCEEWNQQFYRNTQDALPYVALGRTLLSNRFRQIGNEFSKHGNPFIKLRTVWNSMIRHEQLENTVTGSKIYSEDVESIYRAIDQGFSMWDKHWIAQDQWQ